MALTLTINTVQDFLTFSGVTEFITNSTEGQITILPGHTKFLTKMECGAVQFNTGKAFRFFLGDAIICVENDLLTVTTDFFLNLNQVSDVTKYHSTIKLNYYKKLQEATK